LKKIDNLPIVISPEKFSPSREKTQLFDGFFKKLYLHNYLCGETLSQKPDEKN